MHRLLPLPLSLAIALSLTACSSGSDSSTPSNDSPPAVISADNGGDIISGTVELLNKAISLNAQIINLSNALAAKSAPNHLEERIATPRDARFAKSIHLDHLARTTPKTAPCPAGGSYSLDTTDLNGDEIFNDGDARILAFTDCRLNANITIKGNAISTLHSRVDTDTDNWSQTYTTDFNPMTLLDSSDNSSVEVEGKRTVEIKVSPTQKYVKISATSLHLVVDGDTAIFTDLNDTVETNYVSGTWENTVELKLDGTLPGGSLTGSTSPSMTGVVANTIIPLEGVLTVNGGNDSFAKLNAGTGNPATLMLDINGSSKVLNWADFLD